MSYSRRLVTDGVTIMNKDLYDNLQDGIDELKQADENTQGEIKNITDSIEDGLANVEQDLFLLSEKVDNTKDSLQSDITGVSNKVAEVGGQLTEVSETITTQIGAKVDDVLTDTTTLKTGVTNANTKLSTLETNLASTKQDVGGVKSDLTKAKTDILESIGLVKSDTLDIKQKLVDNASSVSSVASKVSQIITDVAGVNSNVSSVGTKVDTANTNITEVKNNVSGVKTDVAGIKTDIADVKNSIILLDDIKKDIIYTKDNITIIMSNIITEKQTSTINVSTQSVLHEGTQVTLFINGKQYAGMFKNLSCQFIIEDLGVAYISNSSGQIKELKIIKGVLSYEVDLSNYVYMIKDGKNIDFSFSMSSNYLGTTEYLGEPAFYKNSSSSGSSNLLLNSDSINQKGFSKFVVRFYISGFSGSYYSFISYTTSSYNVQYSKITFYSGVSTYKWYSMELNPKTVPYIRFEYPSYYHYFTDMYLV